MPKPSFSVPASHPVAAKSANAAQNNLLSQISYSLPVSTQTHPFLGPKLRKSLIDQ